MPVECQTQIARLSTEEFRDLVIGLIRDWGTALTLSLYQEAIVALLGGPESVEAMVPLQRDAVPLGNQRYHLLSPNSAFRLTAMNRDTSDCHKHLARLISFSPLHTIHWINVAHHKVTLTTITNN